MNQNQKEQQASAQKLMSTQEGQKLLKLLSQDGGSTLRNAGNALKQGDTRQVQELMEPLLQNPEVQQLLKTLEKTMNHG